MCFINYFSNLAIPLIFLLILFYGIIEKKQVFDIFLEGAKEGIQIAINIFPTLIGLFVAIGALRSSGVLDFLINLLTPIINFIGFPKEIMPLAILRRISGSASIAIGTDYSSAVKIKNTRFVLWAALIGDIIRNYCICRFLADYVVKK